MKVLLVAPKEGPRVRVRNPGLEQGLVNEHILITADFKDLVNLATGN